MQPNARIQRAITRVLLIASILFSPMARQAIAAEPAVTVPPADRAKHVRELLDKLEDASHRLPTDTFDPDGVIEQVGRDPEKLLAWVRARTRFVPYAGVLRGPRGVLMDRVGNDLDRSLLLVELVHSSGYEARLAHLKLTEAQAKDRLTRAAATPLPDIAGMPASQSLIELLKNAETHATTLSPLFPQPLGAAAIDPVQLNDARDHWWVQYAQGDQWIDLDPEALKPGSHAGDGAAETLDCPASNVVANIPADQLCGVTFRVIVERWEDGKLTEEPAVEWAMSTWDSPATHVLLTHRVEDGKTVSGGDAKAITTAMLTQKKWRPILRVNGQRARGPKTFDESGVPVASVIGPAKVGDLVRGGLGFGGGLAGGNGDAAPANSVLTAEWLDLVITVPGRPPETVRREIFDSIGPAARVATIADRPKWNDTQRLHRALALNAQNDNLVSSCRVPFQFTIMQIQRRLYDSREKILRAVADPKSPANRAALLNSIQGDPLARFAFARSYTGGEFGERTFIDRPVITRLIVGRRMRADGSMPTVATSDLAFNPVAALGATAEARFRFTLSRGVGETAEESIAVGNWPRADVHAADAAPPANTLAVFTLAANQSGQVTCLRNPAELERAILPLSPDVRQRIAADLQAGQTVVLPGALAAGVPVGWWRIDPKTGAAVGVMDSGLRGDMVEYDEMEWVPDEYLGDVEPTEVTSDTYIPRRGGMGGHTGGYPGDVMEQIDREAALRGVPKFDATGVIMSQAYRDLFYEMCSALAL